MRWNVAGVDAGTGRPAKLSIEAPTLDEARRLATYNGVVVAAGDSLPPPPIDYRSPQATKPAPAPVAVPRRRRWPHLLLAAGLAVSLGVTTWNRRESSRRTEERREESRLHDLSFRETYGTITIEEKSELALLRQRDAQRNIERVRRGK